MSFGMMPAFMRSVAFAILFSTLLSICVGKDDYDEVLKMLVYRWDDVNATSVTNKPVDHLKGQLVDMLTRLLVSLIMGLVLLVLLAIATGALSTKTGPLRPADEQQLPPKSIERHKRRRRSREAPTGARSPASSPPPAQSSCLLVGCLRTLGAHVLGWPPRPSPYAAHRTNSDSSAKRRGDGDE